MAVFRRSPLFPGAGYGAKQPPLPDSFKITRGAKAPSFRSTQPTLARPPAGPQRIAVVHDWLDQVGGAERVLNEILHCFPDAELFSVVDVLPMADRDIIMNKKVQTTFIQKLPGAKRYFRYYLPIMPLAVEQIDLGGYDIVISSSWAVAKGVITGPEQLHVAYVHTPIRYAWDQQQEYLRECGVKKTIKRGILRIVLHWIRLWDVRTANGVDVWVANSANVARRIRKIYRQNAEVLHPPVAIDDFPFSSDKQDYYITCSRLVPHKRVDLIVRAFLANTERHLVVIGDGPELTKLRQCAQGATNIVFAGHRNDKEMGDFLKNAKAFILAAHEDFGIAPVEAQACGTPVIAYAKGGALETVNGLHSDDPTGCFFYQQTSEAINGAIDVLEALPKPIDSLRCRVNAARFNSLRFRNRMQQIVAEHWSELTGAEDVRKQSGSRSSSHIVSPVAPVVENGALEGDHVAS